MVRFWSIIWCSGSADRWLTALCRKNICSGLIFLIEGRRLDLFVFLVFLLPGLPKDALTYLVSFQSKIKPMRFFILTTIGRTPATILTVFVGGSLWNGNYRLAIVLSAAMLLLAVLGIGVKKYIDRRAKRRAQAQEQAQEKENW